MAEREGPPDDSALVRADLARDHMIEVLWATPPARLRDERPAKPAPSSTPATAPKRGRE